VKRALSLALVVLAVSSFAQEDGRLGKSNAQIVKMGRTGWYNLYTKKMGESTMAMVSAESLYADARSEANDRLLKTKSAGLQKAVPQFRKVMQSALNDAISIGTAMTGGGTMWNVTSASTAADVEDIVFGMLQPSARPKRDGATKLAVSERLSGLAAEVKAAAKEIDSNRQSSNMSAKAASQAVVELRKSFARLEALPISEADKALARATVLGVLRMGD